MNLLIAQNQLSDELDTLARFSDTPAPAVTRVVFTGVDISGRQYVKRLCTDAGLAVREDAVGNTFARWIGSDPSAAAVGTGSHIDAIPHAGRYDGTVGVLGGLEAIRALQRAGFTPRRSIELLLFTSEEPTRFGIGCLGSRLLAGGMHHTADEGFRDREGKTLYEVRHAAGFTGPLETVRLPDGYYSAFVELHIEQGPLLERDGVPLGLVTAIAGPASYRVTFHGEGGHAGAVLMPQRRDAFLAAAEVALAAEKAAKSSGAVDTVATAGVCEVFPGAINSIPSRVKLELDIRDIDEARRDAVVESVRQVCSEVATRRRLGVELSELNADAPAQCAPTIVDALGRACEAHGIRFQKMISRAYHDSLFMARLFPTAMLFIPCRDGVSHRPDEYASPEDIACGTLVLAETLAELSLRAEP